MRRLMLFILFTYCVYHIAVNPNYGHAVVYSVFFIVVGVPMYIIMYIIRLMRRGL